MDKYEATAKYNIAETCVASISVQDLLELSEDPSAQILDNSTKMTYGSIRGSDKLRSNLARLYSARTTSTLPAENILITAGAIAANFNVFIALLRKGDHVICHYPTYQQLYEVPATLGAEVSFWRAREKKGWQLDLEELKGLLRPNTKMIIIKFVALVRTVHSLLILCDASYLYASPTMVWIALAQHRCLLTFP